MEKRCFVSLCIDLHMVEMTKKKLLALIHYILIIPNLLFLFGTLQLYRQKPAFQQQQHQQKALH